MNYFFVEDLALNNDIMLLASAAHSIDISFNTLWNKISVVRMYQRLVMIGIQHFPGWNNQIRKWRIDFETLQGRRLRVSTNRRRHGGRRYNVIRNDVSTDDFNRRYKSSSVAAQTEKVDGSSHSRLLSLRTSLPQSNRFKWLFHSI
jgi:hypothetical protein